MALMRLEGVSFRYVGAKDFSLSDVGLTVAPGEFVLVVGPSGSGKTTLLRLMKPGLAPAGERRGRLLFREKPVEEWPPRETAAAVGFVSGDSEAWIVADEVWSELGWTLEQIGAPAADIRLRVAETAQAFGLAPLLGRRTYELSDGEKQLVHLASVLVARPELLLLDEPVSRLDPVSAGRFWDAIARLRREYGIAVVCADHRAEPAFAMADRVVCLDEGRLLWEDSPRRAAYRLWRSDDVRFCGMVPEAARICLEFAETAGTPWRPEEADRLPLSVREAKAWLASMAKTDDAAEYDAAEDGDAENGAAKDEIAEDDVVEDGTGASFRRVGDDFGGVAAVCRDVWFGYTAADDPVLRGLDLTIRRGQWLALLGGNGSGKSTLLRLIAGFERPLRGDVRVFGRPPHRWKDAERPFLAGYLSAEPRDYFAGETVKDDLLAVARRAGCGVDEAMRLADIFGIRRLLDRHPHDLSAGERQQAAIALLLLFRPRLLLLDEPTFGLDAGARRVLIDVLRAACRLGVAVVTATHDLSFAASAADRCALLFDGDIAAEGETDLFFSDMFYYAPERARIIRNVARRSTFGSSGRGGGASVREEEMRRWWIASGENAQ